MAWVTQRPRRCGSAGGIRQLEVLDRHHKDDIVPVILEEPDHHRALTVALHVGHRFDHVEWGANPTYRYSVGDPRREAFHLVNLSRGEPAHDTGRVRDVLPRPVAHALMVSACRRIWLISAAAARRSARSGDSATMRSQARNRPASSGHRATATQLNQCSTKYRAGSRLYSSRARAVAAVQSASNLARAAGSRRATAARIAAGSRSGSGTTGCSPDIGRWLMQPMLTYPSDSRPASSRLRQASTSTPPPGTPSAKSTRPAATPDLGRAAPARVV